MDRIPNFNNDLAIGEIGESYFINYAEKYLTSEINKLVDVRNDEKFQLLDIDFVILKNDYSIDTLLNNIRDGHPDTREHRQRNKGYAIEVKTDLRTHGSLETGNIVYEIISHNMPGCMARCYADFLFYVCLDNNTHNIEKIYFINVYKWREWICNNSNLKKHIRSNAITNEKDKICNYLCPIKNLIENSIAKDITDKFLK